jgi:hypothetical protein
MNTDPILDKCRTPYWYPLLANYTFPTNFVKLKEAEIAALAAGESAGDQVRDIIARLAMPMSFFPGNCFVFGDLAAPTDTERFLYKRGAVYSAKSAWRFLAESAKIRKLAEQQLLSHVCIRPFRRMNKTREFRLFIYQGQLKAMSQYWLIRHFHRLEKVRNHFWKKAQQLVGEIAWILPLETVVMDIYFTAEHKILIIDFNPWGPGTNPLLLKQWDLDWNQEFGLKLIPPPTQISGNVNVSF